MDDNQPVTSKRVVSVRGTGTMWDGTTNVIVSSLRPIRVGVAMPRVHDWH